MNWREWIVADSIAGVAVVGLGAGSSAALLTLFEGGWFGVVASTLLFAAAGAGVLGMLQHRALTPGLPFLKRGAWVWWTGLGSGIAWLVVAVPIPGITGDGALIARSEWWRSPPAVLALLGGLGVVVPLLQLVPLSEWTGSLWRWSVGSLLGWGLASGLVLATTGPIAELAPISAIPAAVAVLALGGSLVGITQAWSARRAAGDDEYAHHVLGDLGSVDLSE